MHVIPPVREILSSLSFSRVISMLLLSLCFIVFYFIVFYFIVICLL